MSTAISTPNPFPVPIEVQFGPPLNVLAGLASADALRLRLCMEAALQGLLNDLGIPGGAEVEFAAGDSDPIRVTVCGSPAPFSDLLAQAIWDYVGATPLGSSGPDFSLEEWTRRNTPLDPDRWPAIAEFLSRLAVEVVKQRPERLLQSAQASAYLGDAGAGIDAAEFLEIARQLLKLKLSIRDREVILRHIRDGASAGLGRESIIEEIVNDLRPRALTVEMHPAGLKHFFGLDLKDQEQRSAEGTAFAEFREMFGMMREGLFYELGIRVPPVEFRANHALNPDGFAFRLNHVSCRPCQGLGETRLLVNDTPDRLKLLKIVGRPAVNPANGNACSVIAAHDGPDAEKAGLTTWTPLGYLVLSLAAEIRRGAARLLHSGMAEAELARLRDAFPALVWAAMDAVSPAALTRVLRGLLWEEIGIRDLRTILSRIAAYDTVVADTSRRIVFDDRLAIDKRLQFGSLREPDLYVEFVRQGMKNYLGHKHTRGTGNLLVYLLSPELEAIVLEDLAARRGAPGSPRMTAGQSAEIRSAIAAQYRQPGTDQLVILTFAGIRGAVRKLIEDQFPRLGVLAYEELAPDLKIQPLARISLPEKSLVISHPALGGPSA
ncbi:MAG TPA: FHIPEP family type III secretion protein [Candidatus Acidoferrales bacterium]|nr:FHIPEP family type III secretion protein [Candidatus Acidoferrales bacterium]